MKFITSTREALRHSSLLQRFKETFPRTHAFLTNRTRLSDPLGLRVTIGCALALLFWFFFLAVAQDLIWTDPLIRSDLRVITFLQTLRNPSFNGLMLFFTYLGNWQIILAATVLFSLLLYLRASIWWLSTFLISLGSGEVLNFLLKLAFGRNRPDLNNALVHAGGSSFPSGHAFAAVAVYGFIAIYLASRAKTLWNAAGIVVAAGLLIVAIGFSRVYLGVHWPSDVLAGSALGGAWVTTVITAMAVFAPQKVTQSSEEQARSRWQPLLLFSAWALWTFGFFISHPLIPRATASPVVIELPDANLVSALFQSMPRFTEDITGATIEPINIIIVGRSSDLPEVFNEAGWRAALPLTPGNGLTLVYDELTNRPNPAAPGLPVFLNGEPNDLTYEKPTPRGTARERHHLHLWTTPFRVGEQSIWVGTVHLDTTGRLSALGLPFHQIDPAVDQERSALLSDLKGTRCYRDSQMVAVTAPLHGSNAFGSRFFTDGQAELVRLDCSAAAQ